MMEDHALPNRILSPFERDSGISQTGRLPAGEEFPSYVELSPSPDLGAWIECYWAIRATDSPPVPNRVLPDGCADLVAGIAGRSEPVVVGTMRTAAVVPLTGRVDLFGVRFHPGCALPFLGVPLAELTDRRVALDQLWGAGADAMAEACGSTEPRDRVTPLEQALRDRLRRASRAIHGDQALTARAVRLLRQARGSVGVREVASALGVGERRLERAFDRLVGLSPKALARVLRFRQAVQDIQRAAGRPPHGWTAVAFGAGYADQSHLIRDFKSLAGVTPARYLAERSGVGSIQYSGSKPA